MRIVDKQSVDYEFISVKLRSWNFAQRAKYTSRCVSADFPVARWRLFVCKRVLF